METLTNDVRYGLRTLLRSPGFAAVAVLTLALGIGANTAIFSVINGVILKPLPYPDSDRLVTVFHFYPSYNDLEAGAAVPTYLDLREDAAVFQDVAVATFWGANFAGAGEPERIVGSLVSGEFFTTYGVPAALGRPIVPEDVAAGRENIVVLGHGLWQRAFGGDPDVIGQAIHLDGEAYEVVGVMPRGFSDFFNSDAQVWAPAIFGPAQSAARTSEFLSMTARLAPGVSVGQARDGMTRFADRLKEEYPAAYPADWTLRLRPLEEQGTGNIRPALLVLLGAVGFVLLIAVANVANLLLARATRRRKEIAIRTALGASRRRLLRQLLTESVLLALVGGALGVLLAYWGVEALLAFGPENLPRLDAVTIDARVLLFAFGASLLAGLLFGLLPALQAAEANPQTALREEGRGSDSAFGHGGIRKVVVVAEIALAVVLIVGAGLMIRSFIQMRQVDPGFVADNAITLQTALAETEYPEGAQRAAFFREALREIEALPGVRAAGAISTPPVVGSGWTWSYLVEGYTPPEGAPDPWGEFRVTTPGYFEALRVPLIRGREFSHADDAGAPAVAIVDQVLAEQFWPGEDPIGKRVGLGAGGDSVAWREVVGVVGHVMSQAVELNPKTQLYVPHAQMPLSFMTLIVRSTGDAAALAPAVGRAVLRVSPVQPVYNVKPVEAYLAESMAQGRFLMLLLAAFAALALTLAAVGIYGVMSYAVAQRTREMGIRMALGAESGRVLSLVLRQGMGAALLGVGIGIVVALALVRFLRGQLYGVAPSDPLTFLVAVTVFTGVAALATYIPARRATRVDPMTALRAE